MITHLTGFRRDDSLWNYGFIKFGRPVFAFKKLNANKVRSRTCSKRFCIAVLEIPRDTWIGTESLNSLLPSSANLSSTSEQLPDSLMGKEVDTSILYGKCRAEQVVVKGFIPLLNRSFPESKKTLKYAYAVPNGRQGIRYSVGEVIKPLNRINLYNNQDDFFSHYTCAPGIHLFFKIEEANDYGFW